MLKSFYLRYATLFLPLWPSVSVRLSVRQSQADILSKKRTDRARALYRGYPPFILHCCRMEFGNLQKYSYFPLELSFKFRT